MRSTTVPYNVTVGYTIHNKAHLIPQICEAIKKCFNKNDEIIFLFDNCTDKSKEVALEQAQKHDLLITGYAPPEEMFETMANNFILKKARNEVIILFQDDMICKDEYIVAKIDRVRKFYGDDLGLLGGRDGFELKSLEFPEKPVDKFSSWIHKKNETSMLAEGEFVKRTFINRGPLVFTKKLIETCGYLNENYYPQYCDDMEYSARAKFLYGKKNVVFQCDIESRLEWGATRQKNTSLYKLTKGKHYKKNWNLFISTFGGHIVK